MTHNWGILGTGMIAGTLAKAIDECPNARLLAVGSREADRATAFAQEQGAARAHASYEALLADDDVQFVYNSLPNSLHAEWAIKAARAGKHILCEKPLAVTVDEARSMFAAAKDASVVLMEAFMYRCHPQMERLREIVTSGQIGQVKVIRSRFSYGMSDLTNIRFSAPLHGGALMDVGCYCVNFSRFIAGMEPSQVYGSAVFGDISRVDESFVGTLTFPNGILAQLDSGMVFAGASGGDIMGTEGTVSIPVPWKPGDEALITVTAGGHTSEEHIAGGNPYMLQVEAIQECVDEGTPCPVSREDSIGNTAAVCALLTSAREGRAVSM